MKKKKNVWLEIMARAMSGEKNIPSPFANEGKIESIFVMVLKDKRLGWGVLWCSVTLRAIRLSRMEVPETVEYVYNDEADKMMNSIPSLEFESFT